MDHRFDTEYVDVQIEAVNDVYRTLAWKVKDEPASRAGGFLPRIAYERALKMAKRGLYAT